MAGRKRAARERWLIAIGLLAVAAAAYAAAIAYTGGFDLRIGRLRLRSHSWLRPALLALVTGVPVSILARQAIARALRSVAEVGFGPRPCAAIAAAASIWAIVAGLAFGTFAAGGADSYGYLSQARLFASGHLTDTIPRSSSFTWPEADATLTPLAFTRAAADGRMAPVYPPGLPLLLAPLTRAGDRAAYVFVPVSGALLIWTIFALGRSFGDPLAGAAAAALLSVSPTFLYQVVQPMSDVPAAACWMLALLAAARGGGTAGVACALAILIRPNLAPLGAFVLAAVWFVAPADQRKGRAIRFLVCAAAALAMLGWIQFVRYGSPLASGYGDASELFSLAHIAPNLSRYPRWLTETHTGFIWLFVLAPVWIRRTPAPRALAWSAYGMAFASIALYLAYVPFRPEEWFYTRFLLPGIGLMLLFAAGVSLAALRRLPAPLTAVVVVLGTVTLGTVLLQRAIERGAFSIHRQEEKYVDAGAFVRERLPSTALVVAMQHSGSIRYYAGRDTLRWDLLQPRALDGAIAALRRGGFEPYAVLDAGEVPAFRERFGPAGQRAAAGMTLVAVFGDARVYRFE